MSRAAELFKQPGSRVKGDAAKTRARLKGLALGAWRRFMRLSRFRFGIVERYCRIDSMFLLCFRAVMARSCDRFLLPAISTPGRPRKRNLRRKKP